MFSSYTKAFVATVGALLAVQLTGTLAAPTPMCSPNFQGQAVAIINQATSNRWTVWGSDEVGATLTAKKNGKSTFRLEFTGQPANDYIIKLNDVPANDLLIQGDRSKIILGSVLPVSSPTWTVHCTQCREPGTLAAAGQAIGLGCYISRASDDVYVTEKPLSSLMLSKNMTAGQLFAFVAV